MIPLYAKWWAWYGGVSFGPRFFMLGTVPLAMAAAAAIERTDRTAARSVVLCVAIVMSAWVAVAGTVFGVTAVAFDTCVSGGTFLLEPLCWYTPEYSGLWTPLWEPGPIGSRDVVFIVLVGAAVLPSLTIAAAPLWSSARRAVERAVASCAGRGACDSARGPGLACTNPHRTRGRADGCAREHTEREQAGIERLHRRPEPRHRPESGCFPVPLNTALPPNRRGFSC